jgi:hypothetical protein
VSLELTSVCIVDAQGRIICETKVPSDPEDLVRYFQSLKLSIERVGLEACPLSQWILVQPISIHTVAVAVAPKAVSRSQTAACHQINERGPEHIRGLFTSCVGFQNAR